MKTIQMTEFGGPEVLQLVDVDRPQPGPGQILIRVESAAVNFADVMRRRNDAYPFPTPLPFVPGSEVAGTVETLGDGVDGPPPGAAVFAVVGGDGSTGYAQYAVADAQQVIPIPAGVSMDEAAGIVIAGTTAMLTLTDRAGLQPGETVLIGGAGGGVGTVAAQIARTRGADKIIGLASSDDRRASAVKAGFDHVVDSRSDWVAAVRDLTGGQGADVVLEMAGGASLASGLEVLAPFGRLVVYGMASGVAGSLTDTELHRFLYEPSPNQTISAFNIGLYFGLRPHAAVAAMTKLIELVASGSVQVHVGETHPLADAAEAHRRLEQRETTGKVVLHPWP